MGAQNETATSTSGSSNKEVNALVSQLATGTSNAYKAGPKVFNQSLYAGVGPTTQNAWQSTLGAANNGDYTNGVNGALSSFSNIARGDYLQNGNPYFEQNLAKTLNDTSSGINAGLGASGRLGSNLQIQSLSEGLGNVSNAARSQNYETERDRQVQAAGMLPGLYQAGLAPSAIQGQVGAAMDADKQAQLQAQYELFGRQTNADTDLLAKLTSILSGNAASAGTTTTETKPGTPLWQTLLGYVAGNAGKAAGSGAFGS